MLEIHKILVPVDFSECSKAALESAAALAERFEASVDVLHVWEPPHLVGPEFLIRERGETGHPIQDIALEQARKEMDRFLSTFPNRERFNVRFESGKPYKTITALASSEHYDAIVMGTHGRSGLPRMLIGSVAEKVVRTAPCPVVTVREPGGTHAEVKSGDNMSLLT
jgi:nucleotide-binding universal stress UspA family protein